MKYIASLALSFMFVMGLWTALAGGEHYSGKRFPPAAILYDALKSIYEEEVEKFLGKTENSDGTYTVYYEARKGENSLIDEVNLRKLDTNLWLIYKSDGPYRILERSDSPP